MIKFNVLTNFKKMAWDLLAVNLLANMLFTSNY